MTTYNKNQFSPQQGAMLDSEGNVRNLADTISEDGKLKMDWESGISLTVSDIQIGAVELKDAESDTRAKVGTKGLEVEVKNDSAIEVTGSVEISNTTAVPIEGQVTIDSSTPVDVAGTVEVTGTVEVSNQPTSIEVSNFPAEIEVSNIVTAQDIANEVNQYVEKRYTIYNDNAAFYADAMPPSVDPYNRDGFHYQNNWTAGATTAQKKVNWYFFDGARHSTTFANLQGGWALLTIDRNSNRYPWFFVYGSSNGTTITSTWTFYKTITDLVPGKTYLFYFGAEPTVHPEYERINMPFFPSGSVGTLQNTEAVVAIALTTDSNYPANTMEMQVYDLGYKANTNSVSIRLEQKNAGATTVTGSVEVTNTETEAVWVQGGVKVTNNSTHPAHITGTVEVTNTTALPISGAVSINNAPTAPVPMTGSVTVSNAPTAPIPITGSVTVGNANTAPVPVRVQSTGAVSKQRATVTFASADAFTTINMATLSNSINRLIIYQVCIGQRMFDSSNYGARGGCYAGNTSGAELQFTQAAVINYHDNGSIFADFGEDGWALPAGHRLALRLHSYNTGTTCNGIASVLFREVAASEVLA